MTMTTFLYFLAVFTCVIVCLTILMLKHVLTTVLYNLYMLITFSSFYMFSYRVLSRFGPNVGIGCLRAR